MSIFKSEGKNKRYLRQAADHSWSIATYSKLLFFTLILALPTLLNGSLFLFPDSATYLSQGQAAFSKIVPVVNLSVPTLPQGKEVLQALKDADPATEPLIISGRSIYYGVFAYLAYGLTQGWAVVFIQALCVSFPTLVLLQSFRSDRTGIWAASLACSLAFLTPVGLFVGFLMPDIWIGAMIISIAALAILADESAPWSKFALSLICILAVMFHLSHVVILMAITGVGFLMWLGSGWFRQNVPWILGLRLIGIAMIGLVGLAAFSYVIEREYGTKPISRPHLTAHLVDLGPGAAYAKQACAEGNKLAICPYVDRLPMNWVKFLFSPDPETGVFDIASDTIKRKLSAEDAGFALGTLRYDPVGTLSQLLWDGISQIWTFSVKGIAMKDTVSIERDFPAKLARMSLHSWTIGHGALWDILTNLTYATTFGSIIALAWAAVNSNDLKWRSAEQSSDVVNRFWIIALICISGIILNAMICGILASPYGRFQARVTWIFPLLAVLAFSVVQNSRRPFHTPISPWIKNL